jgi:hypothetical protein
MLEYEEDVSNENCDKELKKDDPSVADRRRELLLRDQDKGESETIIRCLLAKGPGE